jgi:hypothetical protein
MRTMNVSFIVLAGICSAGCAHRAWLDADEGWRIDDSRPQVEVAPIASARVFQPRPDWKGDEAWRIDAEMQWEPFTADTPGAEGISLGADAPALSRKAFSLGGLGWSFGQRGLRLGLGGR